MGLDWNPGNKPLPGREAEAATLRAAILAEPSVETVGDAWTWHAIIAAAILALAAWGIGWFEHPVRSGFVLCTFYFLVGWPIYAWWRGLEPRAAVVYVTTGIWHPVAAYGLLGFVLVRRGWPLRLDPPTDPSMSLWLGWFAPNAIATFCAVLMALGVWAYGWRFFDPRRLRYSGERDALRARFFELSLAAYTTVGAPIVGHDASADAWILEVARRPRDGQVPTEEEVVAKVRSFAGYRVLALAPPSDGLPVYCNAILNPHLELVSFRAAFLNDCEDVIGADLLASARRPMSADKLVAYGNALLERVRAWAVAHGVSEMEHRRDPPDDLESPAGRAHIGFSAAKWCLYWGGRGHGLDPWA
ncbi:MAG: hypothetical protein V4850_10670 [Myxococcota bacterium]